MDETKNILALSVHPDRGFPFKLPNKFTPS